MDLITLNDLFLHELQDLYDAEQLLVDALPQMATSASNRELRDAFLAHLQETQGHVQRLETVFEACSEKPKRESCKGMEGLIKATLSEEKRADEKLTQIAESGVNEWAVQADGPPPGAPEKRTRQAKANKRLPRKQMR